MKYKKDSFKLIVMRKFKIKGDDACTMQLTAEHPDWTFELIQKKAANLGFVASKLTYINVTEKLKKFRKLLKTKGHVPEIDKFMNENPFATKQQLTEHLVRENFYINEIEDTITRRYNYHTQMLRIFKKNNFVPL